MKIYVGNLAPETGAKQLRAMFEPHGRVNGARRVKDKETGELRGFGIVDMDDAQAQRAITALRGTTSGGRTLKVREARLRQPKPEGSGDPTPPPTALP